MFNNVVLNVSTIKPTVNHVNKGMSIPTDLLIDSGATAHMIANRGMFTQFSTEISYYQTGSGEILGSSGRGTICIDFDIDVKSPRLHLTDCVYAPDLHYNLISTPQLATKGVKTVLGAVGEPSELVYTGGTLAYADLTTHNTYVLRLRSLPTLNKMTNSVELWHQRLAHIEGQAICGCRGSRSRKLRVLLLRRRIIWAAQREGVLRIASQPYVISRTSICGRSPP